MFHDGESNEFSDLVLFRTIERKYRNPRTLLSHLLKNGVMAGLWGYQLDPATPNDTLV